MSCGPTRNVDVFPALDSSVALAYWDDAGERLRERKAKIEQRYPAVDETLRSAGGTDNEIPRRVLSLLTQFHERGIPIVICTGQTLEIDHVRETDGLVFDPGMATEPLRTAYAMDCLAGIGGNRE